MSSTVKRAATESVAPPAKRTQADPSKSIKETDVGITQYINKAYKHSGGFYGEIKQRYSDFQVFEINMAGKVVHLTDTGVDLGPSKKERHLEKRSINRSDLQNLTPEEVERVKREKKEKSDAESAGRDGSGDSDGKKPESPKYTLTDSDREKLLTFISAAELEEIEALFGNGGKMETKSTFNDKASRTQLHQLIRQAFEGQNWRH
ncbi:hypothetical protein JCM33374_g5274 [Metschnikowia sp. JCM 33374]|nr:hypothetical protein JCM33374_g5274 [Metschnikowia sp. JCM 33374]